MSEFDVPDLPRSASACGTTFEVRLGTDDLIRAVVGPMTRVLRPDLRGGQFVLVVERDGEIEEVPLWEALRQHRSWARAAAPVTPFGAKHELLNWVSDAKREQALVLERHLLDVLYGRTAATGKAPGPYDASTSTVSERRKAKIAETAMSESTMTRRLQGYRESGVSGLVRHASRALARSGALNVDPAILAVVKEGLSSRAVDSRKALNNEYALIAKRLQEQGLVTRHRESATDAVPFLEDALPFEQFTKMARFLLRGRDPRTAKTRQQQGNRPRVDDYRHRGFDFADRVEMDSTPIDVFVRGTEGPVRAHAVFAICTSTRYLWVRVVAGAPRGRDLALLLWDMAGAEAGLLDGEHEGAKRPESFPALPRRELTVNAWRGNRKPPAVLPGAIWLDHGAEEENQQLLGYCSQLGITVNWARTREPTDKAYVESAISEFARMCQLLPGHKGNTVENRPHADPDPRSVLTIEMLHEAVTVWQALHVRTEHTGLPHPHVAGRFLSPLEAVEVAVTRGVPVRGFTDPTRALGLLKHIHLTPQDDGVTYRRRRYTCPGYEDIITASLGPDGLRGKVTFYLDPNRPGRMFWPSPHEHSVRVLMCPEAAGEALMPFADLRDEWLRHVVGHKPATPATQAMRRVDLEAEMADAMSAFVPEPARRGDNVVELRAGRGGLAQGRGASGGWDLSSAMDILRSAAEDATASDPDAPGGDEEDG